MANQQNIPFSLMRIPLILSGLIYLAIGVGCFALTLFEDVLTASELPAFFFYGFGIFAGLLGLATIILACIVHKPSKAIYITSLIITVLYIPSAYIFFGIPMVIFLVRKDVREYYGINL